jgi:TPR repeat protein
MVRALKFGLAVLLLISARCGASGEQSQKAAEAAAECDRLAAPPLEDDRKSAGVELDEIDGARAIPACQDAVNAGDLPAMAHLARAFVKKGDYTEALRWFERSASMGNAAGMNGLGYLYERGYGVTEDFAKARDLWEKATAQGNAQAMTTVGSLYFYGHGVSQDYTKARERYEKAAEKGNSLAMTFLGGLYRHGKGVPQDYAKALDWFDEAAKKGNAQAMYSLGALYLSGGDVPQDIKPGNGLAIIVVTACHRTSPRPASGMKRPPQRTMRRP